MKQVSTNLIINEGKTFNYVIPFVFSAIGSIISFVFFFPLGIFLALVSISFAIIETGLEFNQEKMEYRKFKSLLGYSWGNWKKIHNPGSFHLRLSVESQTYRTYTMGTSPTYYGNSQVSSKSITYDIMVQTKSDKWIILYEFLSYKLALQLVRGLQENGTFEVTDHIALKLEENQQKRMNRMR